MINKRIQSALGDWKKIPLNVNRKVNAFYAKKIKKEI